MDFTTLTESLQQTLGDNLPAMLGALAVLILGWFVALVVRAACRRGLKGLRVNERIRSATGQALDLERVLAAVLYYVILILALVGFFNVLDLGLVSGPLQSLVDQVFAYAPKLFAGLAVALLAWILAMVVRGLVTRLLSKTSLDEKLSTEAGVRPVSESLGVVLYWLVILLFLPGVIGILGLEGLLAPAESMLEEILGLLPDIFAAVLIGLVGWFLARLLRDLTTNLLSATGLDRLGDKAGLKELRLSKVVGLVVYIVVLIPALVAALDTLNIESVSVPAIRMLETFLAAIPNVFAAMIILTVAYVVSRFVGGLTAELLQGVGADRLPAQLGLEGMFGERMTLSALTGNLIVFFAMIFATMEAANLLGFVKVSELVARFIEFGGQVLLGIMIIAIGFWLSRLAAEAIRGLTSGTEFLAGLARVAILGLVFAMGLRAMGIADDIVNLGFGLTLGAVAVAVALSFGLGGREAAGEQMSHWLRRLRERGQ